MKEKLNDFQRLMQMIKLKEYKENVECENWKFVISKTKSGTFSVFYKNDEVVVIENYKITDFMWGYSFRENDELIDCVDILKSVLLIPNVYLNIYDIETTDGLAALGYWDATHLMSLDEEMDLQYERGWYATKAGKDKTKKDFVLFWDNGNSWCSVDKVFENITEEEFHKKVKEYLKEKYEK